MPVCPTPIDFCVLSPSDVQTSQAQTLAHHLVTEALMMGRMVTAPAAMVAARAGVVARVAARVEGPALVAAAVGVAAPAPVGATARAAASDPAAAPARPAVGPTARGAAASARLPAL
jgi:hypothetical protein